MPFEVSTTRAVDVSPEERQKIFEKAWAVGGTRFFAQSFSDVLTNQESNDAMAAFIANYIRSVVKDPATAKC